MTGFGSSNYGNSSGMSPRYSEIPLVLAGMAVLGAKLKQRRKTTKFVPSEKSGIAYAPCFCWLFLFPQGLFCKVQKLSGTSIQTLQCKNRDDSL